MGRSPRFVTFKLYLVLPLLRIMVPLSTRTAPGCFSGEYSLASGRVKKSADGRGKKDPASALDKSPSSEQIGS